jgi:hypothetical protein
MRWAAIASMIGAAVLMVTALALTPAASGQGQGNPGTIKINDEDADRFPANQPHVGCVFTVGFFDFPEGSEASVDFAAQPPTGTDTLLSDTVALNGDTARTYDLTNLLANFEPHPQQGFHIRLDVDVAGAPGGSKTKVFWSSAPRRAGDDHRGPDDDHHREGQEGHDDHDGAREEAAAGQAACTARTART